MTKREPLVLGVLGGMGTYATIHFFKQYAEVFTAEKEWDRPRILIDNNCTMPSRVRAILYGERRQELVEEMSNSLAGLMHCGANRMVLACNTSHLFLEEVYQRLPQAREKVVHIIDACVEHLIERKVKKVYLLATEGTLISGVYQKKLEAAGILCQSPGEDEFPLLRDCIEAVKQNKLTDEARKTLRELISRADEACILGCTELPILYDSMGEKTALKCEVIDPLHLALMKIHGQWQGSL